MKKIFILAAFALFTITTSAQEAKAAPKKEVKEKKCCAKETDSKAMTAAEVAKCKAKCKAEGKKCDATMAGTEEKKCCAKKA
ncbi:hypothetical protein QO200_00230 [Flavobacterium sp. Arc3]|jgi:hypothetical protein|uniref:hypothetical protein n=1 Tax=unclassified Flavobacterium TaxID=196869 RepID=UPI00352D0487